MCSTLLHDASKAHRVGELQLDRRMDGVCILHARHLLEHVRVHCGDVTCPPQRRMHQGFVISQNSNYLHETAIASINPLTLGQRYADPQQDAA